MENIETFDFTAPVIPKEPASEPVSPVETFDFTAPVGSQQIEPEVEQEGFIDRAGARLAERNIRMGSDLQSMIKMHVPPQEAMLNIAGELSGSLLDVMGELLVSGGRTVKSVTPDFIKEYVGQEAEAVANGFAEIAKTDAGKMGLKALEGTVEGYREFKSQYPREARAIENFINVALVFAPVKTKRNAEPSLVSKAADKVKVKAESQIANRRKQFVQDLIGPKRDFNVLKKEVPRTKEKGFGPFKRSVVEPSPREVEIAKEVSKIAEVSPRKSIQGNYNVINAENRKLAIKLADDVKAAKVKVPQADVLQRLDDVIDDAISTEMFLVGSGESAAEKLRLNAAKIIIKHSDKDGFIRGESLLQARKELDKVIKSQKPTVFREGTAESAVEIISKHARNAMNDLLDKQVSKSPFLDVKVKKELRRQSLLFDALDNMGPKAAVEANYAIGRALQNAMKVVPFRNEVVQIIAATVGIGGLGAAAFAAPIVKDAGIIGGAAYGLYRGATSPLLKKAISQSLMIIDKAIITSENPSMVKALRADRALIVEMLKNMEMNQEQQ